MELKLFKVVGNSVIHRTDSTILNVKMSEEAREALSYYNMIPANM